MIYHTIGLPARRKFYTMEVMEADVTLERVIAADAPQAMGLPNLIKDANVPVTVVKQSIFSTAKEFEAFVYRLQSKLRNKYINKELTFYMQYAKREKQFTQKERYLLGTRMRLRRLSFEKALSLPLPTVFAQQETTSRPYEQPAFPAPAIQRTQIAIAPL